MEVKRLLHFRKGPLLIFERYAIGSLEVKFLYVGSWHENIHYGDSLKRLHLGIRVIHSIFNLTLNRVLSLICSNGFASFFFNRFISIHSVKLFIVTKIVSPFTRWKARTGSHSRPPDLSSPAHCPGMGERTRAAATAAAAARPQRRRSKSLRTKTRSSGGRRSA